jgi:NRPS condensation-like uncharacterized protein
MTEPFAVPDELTCYYDRAVEPANVHVELRAAGRIDADGVRAAVASVLADEPRLRARRATAHRWQRRYQWVFPPAAEHDPVRLASFDDEAGLSRLRAAFLSVSPALDAAPPLTILVAAGPGGDRLILNAHHAWLDGLSCLRLLGDIASAYSGQQGSPVRAGDVPGGRATGGDLPARAAATGGQPDRSADGREPGPGGAAGTRPARIARIASQRDGGSAAADGYGLQLRSWAGLEAAAGLRSAGYSINDLLVTAMILTIRDWNAERGGRGRQIRITVPIGDRDQASGDGQWANRSRLTAVTVRTDPTASSLDVLDAVRRQTGYAKAHRGAQVDAVSQALTALPAPVAVKAGLLRVALRTAGPLVCDTSLVSNLGVAEPMWLGPDQATGIWFSTSAHMPRGLSVGAVTCQGRLRLTFRYRRALFSDIAGESFARRFCRMLDELAGEEAPL